MKRARAVTQSLHQSVGSERDGLTATLLQSREQRAHIGRREAPRAAARTRAGVVGVRRRLEEHQDVVVGVEPLAAALPTQEPCPAVESPIR